MKSTNEIHQLPQSTIIALKSQTFLNSYEQIIQQLVLNAISRKATKVYLMYNKRLSNVYMYDNGSGINFDQLKEFLVHEFNDDEDRSTIKVSLAAALKDHSRKIEIKSRTSSSRNGATTFKLTNNKIETVNDSNEDDDQTNYDTNDYFSIFLTDVFYKWPVRQKHTSSSSTSDSDNNNVMVKILNTINSIMASRPHIAISLVDENNVKYIDLKYTRSIKDRFLQIYPQCIDKNLILCDRMKIENYTFTLLFSTESIEERDREKQYIYVNFQRVTNSTLSDIIEKVIFQKYADMHLNDRGFLKIHPFVLSIKCEMYLYETNFDSITCNAKELILCEEEKFMKELYAYLQEIHLYHRVYNTKDVDTLFLLPASDAQPQQMTKHHHQQQALHDPNKTKKKSISSRAWRRRESNSYNHNRNNNDNNNAKSSSIHSLYKNFVKEQIVPQNALDVDDDNGSANNNENYDDRDKSFRSSADVVAYDYLKLKQQYYKSFKNGVKLNVNMNDTLSHTNKNNMVIFNKNDNKNISNNATQIRISKQDIKRLKYIGQFDKKFLICSLNMVDEDNNNNNENKKKTFRGVVGRNIMDKRN